jgi:transposase
MASPGRYASVKRFVRYLRGQPAQTACAIIVTPPGDGSGPMVRDPLTGRYQRTRLFVLTLGYSRRAVYLLTFHSSTRTWAELHEQAFRRLGGITRTIVLDNLREGVLKPDIYDPALNPLYRDMLAHYGTLPLPCRVRDPDRKGKVERSVGHAKNTPLKGLRFESLTEAQAYLDHWEATWANTRIHGTTKRQASRAEESHLRALPEPYVNLSAHTAPSVQPLTIQKEPMGKQVRSAPDHPCQPVPRSFRPLPKPLELPARPANQKDVDPA